MCHELLPPLTMILQYLTPTIEGRLCSYINKSALHYVLWFMRYNLPLILGGFMASRVIMHCSMCIAMFVYICWHRVSMIWWFVFPLGLVFY